MKALRITGVPYTDEMIAKAQGRRRGADLARHQGGEGARRALSQGAGAQVRRQRRTREPSELDALIAYLQMLGTLVDFAKFDAAGPNLR